MILSTRSVFSVIAVGLCIVGCGQGDTVAPPAGTEGVHNSSAAHDEIAPQMRALDSAGDYVGMEKVAREYQKKNPGDVDGLLMMARAQFYNGNFAGARDNWNKALEMAPGERAKTAEALALTTRLAEKYPSEKWDPIQMVESEVTLANRAGRELGVKLLTEKKYDEIESLLKAETQKPTVYADGSWKLADIYVGIFQGVTNGSDEAIWKKRHAAIEAWRAARPTSQFAPICLARSWVEGAWNARGDKYANEVPESAWKIMNARLEKAAPLFEKLGAQKAPHLLYYVAAQRFMQLGDAPKPTARDLEQQAIARFPKYTNFYGQQATMLLPRWGGETGEWEDNLAKNADALAARFGVSEGDKLYARVVWTLWDYHENMIDETRIDYDRAQRGFAQILKEYPGSIAASNLAFRLAWQKYDGKTMRSLMKNSIRGRADKELWKDPAQFAGARIGMLRFD